MPHFQHKNTYQEHEKSLSRQERLASWIANHVGTIYFFYFCCLLALLPLFFTGLLPLVQFISSAFLQLVLLPIILISQNLQNRHTELRSEHEYSLNIKEEQQNESIIKQLGVIVDAVK